MPFSVFRFRPADRAALKDLPSGLFAGGEESLAHGRGMVRLRRLARGPDLYQRHGISRTQRRAGKTELQPLPGRLLPCSQNFARGVLVRK